MANFANWIVAVLIVKNAFCIIGEVLCIVGACMCDNAYDRFRRENAPDPVATIQVIVPK